MASSPQLLIRSSIRSHHPLPLHSPSIIYPFFSLQNKVPPRFLPLKASSRAQGGRVGSRGPDDPALLRRPLISPQPDVDQDDDEAEEESSGISDSGDDVVEERAGVGARGKYMHQLREEEWVDWEDQILEDTVPLVGFVRMILHSGKYGSGDKLSPEHEKTILERLLPYHPEFEKKIGCGIDFITIGYHPEFENSRCLFIARKDGELVDFSYWKCIKGLIRKNYPLYADSFILRHFRRRRQTE